MSYTTLADRFWAKVDTSAGLFGCWLWLAASTGRGYGRIKDGGRFRQATHVALELVGRSLPDGQDALHTCDNPPCVNPAHLFPGTDADNARDRDAKGRGGAAHGEYSGRAKFGLADIREIRRLWAGGIPQREIAAAFGMDQSNVSLIVHEKTWRGL